MTPTSRRICLALTLLGLVAVALLTDLRARYDGIVIKAHIAAMPLQGMPEAHRGAAPPDKDDTIERCTTAASPCAAPIGGDGSIGKTLAFNAEDLASPVRNEATSFDNNDERVRKSRIEFSTHLVEAKRGR